MNLKRIDWTRELFEFGRDYFPIILTVLICATVFSYLGRWSQKSTIQEWKEQYEEFRDDVEELTLSNRVLLDSISSLAVKVEAANDSIAALTEDIEVRDRELSTLRRELDRQESNITPEMIEETPPEVQVYISTLERTVNLQEIQIEKLEESNALLRTVNENLLLQNRMLVIRVDSVTSILNNIPDSPDDPDKILGFIPKPTRIQSFLGGVLATVIVIIGVK